MENTKQKRQISEILIGDRVVAGGIVWRVVAITKMKNSLYNIELFSNGEKKMIRKIPGSISMEVL